jgi:lipopolysaccharide biosynthesis regulator YciM
MSEKSLSLENSSNQSLSNQVGLDRREKLKHLLVGKPAVVKQAIHRLHVSGYAEVREWSKPVSAANSLGEPGEVVSILTRQVISDI